MINQSNLTLKAQIDKLYNENVFKFSKQDFDKYHKIVMNKSLKVNVTDITDKLKKSSNDQFIDYVFKSLNKEEKDFLTFCFNYIKNQLIYYLWFQGTDNPIYSKYNNLFDFSENFNFYETTDNPKKEDIETLILLLPHIKDFKALGDIKNLKEIFLNNVEGDFKYSNMFYNLNDQNVLSFTLKDYENFENIKNFFVNNIIILLQTLERTFCRLFVNWINVFPFSYPETLQLDSKYKNYSKNLSDFQNSRIYINTCQLLNDGQKNLTFFTINYKQIKERLLKKDVRILFECFFNGFFPFSTLFDSLHYVGESNGIFWHSLNWTQQQNYIKSFVNNNKFQKLSRIFHILNLSGTLSFCYSSSTLLENLIKINNNQNKDQLIDNDPLSKNGILKKYNNIIRDFGNSFYFLTNSTYLEDIQYYQSLLKIENFLLYPKDDKNNNLDLDLTKFKKSLELEDDEIKIKTDLSNENLKFNVFDNSVLKHCFYKKWINVSEEKKLLYSAQFMSQINVYNKFINNRILFITGGTGTGKSTQFPILLLYGLKAFDYKVNGTIIDTQPRKNATENNAGAVASFMGLFIPKLYNIPYVQYLTGDTDLHFKKEDKPDNLKITFVTDKILLDEINKSFLLLNEDSTNKYDIIVVDEVHEHNKNMDLILTLMRNIVYLNNSIRLVLVSATIEGDEPRYRQYYRYIEDILKYPFNNSYYSLKLQLSYLDRRVNISNPSVTSYKINDYFINDNKSQELGLFNPYSSKYNFKNLSKNDFLAIEEINNKNIFKIINHIISTDSGNKHILIFKAGTEEILNCINYLIGSGINENLYFVPWVNSVTEETKRLISEIEKNPKIAITKIHKDRKKYNDNTNYENNEGFVYNRFVLVATNVVEASITIDDLGYVIDDGFQKSQFYDYETNESKLKKNIISDQSRIQRRGRVGRVMDGDVYYLYQYKDIKDSKVKYKICYENFVPDYFSLIEQQESQKININFNKTGKLNNEFVETIDYSDLVNKKQIQSILKMYYDFNFNFKYVFNEIPFYYENCNNGLKPFFIGNKNNNVYSNFGYDTNIINDDDYQFYLIHPNELNVKRNKINGLVDKTGRSFNYLLYCEKYYILPLIDFYDTRIKKSSFYTDFDKLYFNIFSFLGFDDFNGLLTNFVYLFILSYFNVNRDYFKFSLRLFYTFYCYNKLKNVIDFDYLNKSLNLFNNQFDDISYIVNILNNLYYQNIKEYEKIKELKESVYNFNTIANFINNRILNQLVKFKPYFDIKNKKLPLINQELLNVNFDNLVFLCFYDNIVLPYRNTKSTYISKKIKDQKTIDNLKEQNLFYFVNLFKPITKEIKLDFHNSCIKFTGNCDYYDSNINNTAYIYFDSSETDSVRFIKCLYKINFNDIKIFDFMFQKIKEFSRLNPEHLLYLSNIDYLIQNCHETNNLERVKKYNEVYKLIGERLKNIEN